LVPQPVLRTAAKKTAFGVIYFGSTTPAMREALDVLEASGIHVDALRLCAFPFPDSVNQFIAGHEKIFVVEQNRDAQMRSLLINELDANPAQLVRVLHYDGTPITARFIVRALRDVMQPSIKVATDPPQEKPRHKEAA
jgi:2-oxoglutarate ferredoxin oxidoreductase subunit alpha